MRKPEKAKEEPIVPEKPKELTDGELAAQLQERANERFKGRVQRVMACMEHERIDWRGTTYITPDGRIGVRLTPVDVPEQQ